MFGLGTDAMCQIIDSMVVDVRAGREFASGLYDGLIDGYACKVEPVAHRFHREYLGFALWYGRQVGWAGGLEAVQCQWPDRAGLFPREAGCAPAIVALQTMLD